MTNHSTSVPLDEVEIRADYALKIQEKIRKYMPGLEDFCFNNFHVAIFLTSRLSFHSSSNK
ncbi:hypothetical protein N0V84_002060 [Fusarium piperis]|uniref:Uncharacterized protein n=1 Tax=Fusarium piperis TaxID=1435070 RepID=A0A9W8WJX5_9HYPO|nr:hypothetical protein N0V84_002060 [Fusarium piperis]